jgi:hypothetical protein
MCLPYEISDRSRRYLGTGFLNLVKAKLDMQENVVTTREKRESRTCVREISEGRGVANRVTLTVVTRTYERGRN